MLFSDIISVQEKAIWLSNDDGEAYFITDDMVGCDVTGEKLGSGLLVYSGNMRQQGRVAAKVYAVLHATMRIGTDKCPNDKGKI